MTKGQPKDFKRVCPECRLRATINCLVCSTCNSSIHEQCAGIERSQWNKNWLCLDCSSKQNITKNQEYTTPNSSKANDTPRRRLSGINSSKASDTPRRRLSEINSSLIEILDDIRSSPLAPTCQRDGKAFIAAHSECQTTPLPVLTSVASCQTDFLLETKDASTQTDFEYNCEPSNDASCQTENFPCGNCDSSPLCDPSLPSLLVLKKKLEFVTNEISTFIDLRGNIIKNTLKSVNTNKKKHQFETNCNSIHKQQLPTHEY